MIYESVRIVNKKTALLQRC